MPGVSRDNDKAEGDLIPSQTTVFANSQLVIIAGDEVEPHSPGGIHGPPPPTVPASGKNPGVYVANKLAIIKGDPATCTHETTGSGDVWIYEGYAPPVVISAATVAQLTAENTEIINNPPFTTDGTQVRPNYPGTGNAGVDTLGTQSLVDAASSTASADQIPGFLSQVLKEAATGNWDERNNAKNNPSISNPNIINIWRELNIGSSGIWADDQTPWCAGFVNWVLKKTGYRYMQSARAYDFRDKTSVYGGVQVATDAGQPGDIVVWNYSHVNFIYTVLSPGRYTFCGGNQSDRASSTNNNPSGGTVSNSYPGGYNAPGNITGIYRPVRS